MSISKEKIKVYEMTCTSCENRVEKAISKLDGVMSVKASYSEEFVEVEFDDALCNTTKIKDAIKNAGYSTKRSSDFKLMGIFVVVAIIVLLGINTSGFDMDAKLENASYAVLFVVGVLTSIHCVGMCGGIMLSQSLSKESKNKFEAILPALLYNLGRVISYTFLGGLVGALGSVFSLSLDIKAGLQIFAGLFMVMMGFNMAGFKLFRKLQIHLPHTLCKLKNKSGSPFIVGILNGFMPCGPLQTMQLFALGTGSALNGAISMFVFSIGTVPLMLTFGALSGILSKGYTKKLLKFSGVLIIILGFIMGNRGLLLAGININPMTALATSSSLAGGNGDSTNANVAKATLEDGVQVIRMTANNNGFTPNSFYVEKGIPVKWIINGEALNTCNNEVIARSLNLQLKINKGENIYEFTPGDEDITFSCWMGMIPGVIKVVDDLDTIDMSENDPSLPPPSTGPSCCAQPLPEEPATPSIYGDDISKVPTDQLIKKSAGDKTSQEAAFKGIGYELQPLIVVSKTGSTLKLTFDLSDFDKAEGEYTIVNGYTGDIIATFSGKQGIIEVELNISEASTYAIVKDDSILGIIENVDDLENTDLEFIMDTYLP